ncbi:hypothetical protein IEO21_11193 [Rhodonia placenta]|uniref:Uncharacterized protein n=1 Tax=Rhodonia placenta TaxID=104341 RepID=A0A8H7NQV3_9APHY|nr:hypothetical protein IEO21_11193 [Postia placenta]
MSSFGRFTNSRSVTQGTAGILFAFPLPLGVEACTLQPMRDRPNISDG